MSTRAPRRRRRAPLPGRAPAPPPTPAVPPSIRVVIVDSDLLARRRLRRYLAEEPGVAGVVECADGRAALTVVERERPDVVFVDPTLPGIGRLEQWARGNARKLDVVFLVRHDPRTGGKRNVHRRDYLLKPVAREPIRAVLDRVPRGARSSSGIIGQGIPGRIVVRSGGRILALPASDIDWIEAADNYVRLHKGAQVRVVRETLAGLEARLDPLQFVRIHRCAIVSIGAIEEIYSVRGSRRVRLRSGSTLPVGRVHRQRLRDIFDV